jgi:hypothetical protein
MNSIGIIDESQRKAARIAGFAILFGIVIVVVANYGIAFRFLVPNNAVDTARNIMAHETLFRINIACNLIYVMTVVALLSALYVILKPVNRTLALVAAFCRLVFALMWGVSALNSLGALRLLGDAAYLPVFGADQLQTLARLHLSASFDDYYVGLPFWAVASTICSYLWFKSRYIPRTLAVFGVIASVWGVICAFAFIIFPHFDKTVDAYWFDVPMTLFEVVLAFWLLFKGLSTSGLAGPDKASDRAQADAG